MTIKHNYRIVHGLHLLSILLSFTMRFLGSWLCPGASTSPALECFSPRDSQCALMYKLQPHMLISSSLCPMEAALCFLWYRQSGITFIRASQLMFVDGGSSQQSPPLSQRIPEYPPLYWMPYPLIKGTSIKEVTPIEEVLLCLWSSHSQSHCLTIKPFHFEQ